MNKAILKYSLLLKLSQIGWFEVILLMLLFLGGLGAGMSKSGAQEMFDVFTHPAFLLILGWRFSRDIALNQHSLKDGEYFSLLFTRPITRVSYVFTKALVTSLGCLIMVFALLTIIFLGQLLGGAPHPKFPDGWQCLSLVANSWSFSCLIMMLRVMPPKIGEWALLLCLMGAAGTAFSFGVKVDTPSQQALLQSWEVASAIYHQLFFPAFDAQVVFERAPFSVVPIIAYVSNCLLYLLGATLIINRREFSYAQD